MPIEVGVPVILLALALGLAFIRGALPERIGAGILGAWLLTGQLYHLVAGPGFFAGEDAVYVALDLLGFIGFGALALTANRVWPIAAAALPIIALLGHLAVMIGAPGEPKAYWVMTQLPPVLMSVMLIAGTLAHANRRRRIGPYRSWRRGVGR